MNYPRVLVYGILAQRQKHCASLRENDNREESTRKATRMSATRTTAAGSRQCRSTSEALEFKRVAN